MLDNRSIFAIQKIVLRKKYCKTIEVFASLGIQQVCLTPDDLSADEIRITFGSRDDHTCSTSLFNVDDDAEQSGWPPNLIIGEKQFTARLGPSGGARGYASITGKSSGKNFTTFVKKKKSEGASAVHHLGV